MKIIQTVLVAIAAGTFTASAWDAPTMGWSTWNAYGHRINESIIKAQADALESTGLRDAGYVYLNIDDGAFCGRDENGHLRIHPTRFPNGMKTVVDYIKSKGLKAGTYSDAGNHTCASFWGGDTDGLNTGLYTHDREDIDFLFKELGFEFIKVDFCGGDANQNIDHLALSEKERYTAIGEAIKATGIEGARFNVCRWAYPGTWVEDVATSWRMSQDIYLGWESVKDIIHQNLYLSAYATNGRFNDMDMLEVGRGLTPAQDITHFAMWCMMSSPLLLGCDLGTIDEATLALLTNPELIEVNQDPLALQACVVDRRNGAYILVKDFGTLHGNTRVVALYNPTDAAVDMEIDFFDLDLAGNVKIRDLIGRCDLPDAEGTYSETVAPHSTRIYRLDADSRLERCNYEAETAWITAYQELENNQVVQSGIYIEDDALSGGAKASWLGMRPDNDLQWRDIYSATGGDYTVSIYYLSGADRSFNVEVNGTLAGTFNGNSGGWDVISRIDLPVSLQPGVNTVRLFSEGDWMPDIDRITVEAAGSMTLSRHERDKALRAAIGFDLNTLPAAMQQWLLDAIATHGGDKTSREEYDAATSAIKEAVTEAAAAAAAYARFNDLTDIARANADASVEGPARDNLASAAASAANTVELATSTESILACNEALIAAMRNHLLADDSELADGAEWNASVLIENSTFDTDTRGWSGSPVWGHGCAEYWNVAFATSQTLKGLKDGFYRVEVQALYRLTANDGGIRYNAGAENIPASFFANSESVPVASLYSAPVADTPALESLAGTHVLKGFVNSMYGASQAFAQGLYPNKLTAEVKDGTLRIGLQSDKRMDDCWCCFDNFRLFYLGRTTQGVESPHVSEDENAEYFNLQGQPVSNPAPGTLLIRRTSSKVEKVIK